MPNKNSRNEEKELELEYEIMTAGHPIEILDAKVINDDEEFQK